LRLWRTLGAELPSSRNSTRPVSAAVVTTTALGAFGTLSDHGGMFLAHTLTAAARKPDAQSSLATR